MVDRAVIHFPDLKRTEEFLISQEEVIDASVWLQKGRLMAHVTVTEDCQFAEEDLVGCCLASLGPSHTPDEVQLVCSRRRAA